MSRSNRLLGPGFLLLVVGLAAPLISGCSLQELTSGLDSGSAGQHVAVGREIGIIHLSPLGMQSAEAASQAAVTNLPSEVTMLHFWGAWCPPCRLEYPELSRLVEEFDSLRFLSVSCEGSNDDDYNSLTEDTSQFLRQNEITSSAFADLSGQTRSAYLEISGSPDLFYPTSVLLDADHRVLAVWEGYSPDNLDDMRFRIDAAVRKDVGELAMGGK